MVMTRMPRRLCRGSPAVLSAATGRLFITPLRGKTTDGRAGRGRSACPVRREGEPNSIGSPYPYRFLYGSDAEVAQALLPVLNCLLAQ